MTERTFTQEEVDKLISDRISRERKKAEKEKNTVAEVAVEYPREMIELEKELTKRELILDTKEALKVRGIHTDFADMLIRDNEEETLDAVNKFEKIFKEALETELDRIFNNKSATKKETTNTTQEIPLEVLAKKYTRRNR